MPQGQHISSPTEATNHFTKDFQEAILESRYNINNRSNLHKNWYCFIHNEYLFPSIFSPPLHRAKEFLPKQYHPTEENS